MAIILFTVIIRFALAPLFVRQIRSQREMQRMQPLVREIQRKHKGNRQKITEETMALYKEHGVNQFGGCLPVVLQLPLLFALYQALIRAANVVTLTAEQASSQAFAAAAAERSPASCRSPASRTSSARLSAGRATCRPTTSRSSATSCR